MKNSALGDNVYLVELIVKIYAYIIPILTALETRGYFKIDRKYNREK